MVTGLWDLRWICRVSRHFYTFRSGLRKCTCVDMILRMISIAQHRCCVAFEALSEPTRAKGVPTWYSNFGQSPFGEFEIAKMGSECCMDPIEQWCDQVNNRMSEMRDRKEGVTYQACIEEAGKMTEMEGCTPFLYKNELLKLWSGLLWGLLLNLMDMILTKELCTAF